MGILEATIERNPADGDPKCAHCNKTLPSWAVFCSYCGERIEQQKKDTSNPFISNWLWPAIIMLSAVAAGLLNLVFADTVMRPIAVFWFLFVCPGMTVVRFLSLKEPVVQWTLAVALSFALDGLVASIQLYAGRWSPAGTLALLIGFSLVGTIVQLATMRDTT